MAGVMTRDGNNGTITLTEKGNPKVHYRLPKKILKKLTNGQREVIVLINAEDITTLVQAVERNPDASQ
jgi:ribosomal protein L32E